MIKTFIKKVKTFCNWIIKCLQYSWFLRNDYDWDYSFILKLLKYKLERTRARIKKNNLISDEQINKIGQEIKMVENLIEKYINGDFCSDLLERHEGRWGKVIYLGNNKKYNPTRENATTEILRQQERAEIRRIYDQITEEENKCFEEIFDSMKMYMRGWWD